MLKKLFTTMYTISERFRNKINFEVNMLVILPVIILLLGILSIVIGILYMSATIIGGLFGVIFGIAVIISSAYCYIELNGYDE
jgi:hypothetical protein